MPLKPLLRSSLRRAVRYGAAAFLVLALASALLWLRSRRALDQLDGHVRFTQFTFVSFGGRLEATFSREYYLPVAVADANGGAMPTFGQLRVNPNFGGGDYANRMRWPIAQTSRAGEARVWFPSPEFDASVTRQGPRLLFRGTAHAVVPYWLSTPLLAAPPLVAIGFFLRRRRRTLSPFACIRCGYDCRESPDRCPECGTPRAAGATA